MHNIEKCQYRQTRLFAFYRPLWRVYSKVTQKSSAAATADRFTHCVQLMYHLEPIKHVALLSKAKLWSGLNCNFQTYSLAE